jgi:prophage DNA circulation protein
MAKPTRTASFRGVPFKVFTSEAPIGRRLVEHVFVKRDTPYQEDLGRKAREFTLEAFVIGPDYIAQRDALQTALEAPGSGQLIHPFYGAKQVNVRNCRVREAAGELGMARFDIEFVEAGELLYPKSINDPQSNLLNTVTTLRDASAANFLNKFNILHKAQFVSDSAKAKVEGVSDFIATQTASVSTLSNSVTDLAYSVRNLKLDAAELINTPSTLQTRLSSAMRLLSGAFGSKEDSVKVYSGFYQYGHSDVVVDISTANRNQEKQNSKAINDLISSEALTQSAMDAALIAFKSIEDAQKIRQQLFDEIENQKENSDDDDVYAALLALKGSLGDAIPPANQNLPSIVSIEFSESRPSLSVAYGLYAALDREQDVIDRNRVTNPAFLPGGVPLKVLNNVG